MSRDPNQPNQKLIAELMARYKEASARLRDRIISPPGQSASSQEWNQSRAAMIQGQVDQEISRLKKFAARWTGDAMTDSIRRGQSQADRQIAEFGNAAMKRAGIRPADSPMKGSFAQVDRGAVEVLAKDTVADLISSAEIMQKQAHETLRRMAATKVTNADVNQILTRGVIEGRPKETMRELQRSLEKVYGEKVTIVSRGGVEMQFDSDYYAQMVANTKTREAVCKARHHRLKSRGVDLVVITGRVSENFCSEFLERIFSLSGESEKYPALADLPGGGPPFHPNCSKGTAPYVAELEEMD